MHSIYCVRCGKRVSGNEMVYPTRLFFNLSEGVTEVISPACSEQCSKLAVDNQIRMMSEYIERLKVQPAGTITVNQYMCPSESGC